MPNPSFESYSVCPDGAGQLDHTTNWYYPTSGTSDFFDTCFTFSLPWTGNVDIPQNVFGYQNALLSGGGYAGLFTYYQQSLYREYIQTKLTNTLSITVKYYVAFYVSLGDSSVFATDDIGVYFSQSPIGSGNVAPLSFTPQISNTQGQILNNKLNWKKISGSFIASGVEQYLTIGNFKNDINTDTLRLLSNSMDPDYNAAYYYIDGICVSTDSLYASDWSGLSENRNNSDNIKIYPNPAGDYLNFSFVNHLPRRITLVDNLGRMILEKIINYNDTHFTMDISFLSNGIYTATMEYLNAIETKKIVIINP